MDSRQKEKIGDWLMDIAKYMFTALVLSSILADMTNPWVFVIVVVFATLIFFEGVRLVKMDINDKKK